MLRLITSRWVRLALAAVALVAAVTTVTRLRRRPDGSRTVRRGGGFRSVLRGRGFRAVFPLGRPRGAPPVEGAPFAEGNPAGGTTPSPRGGPPVASSAEAPGSGATPAPRWPPTPILGTPTDDDLRRYTVRPPSAFRSAIERVFERSPRTPGESLDEATRSRLVRWGAVGIGLCLLAFGTQALESAVFSNGTYTAEVTDSRNPPGADEWCGPEAGAPLEPGLRYPAQGEPTTGLYAVVCQGTEELFDVREVPNSSGEVYPEVEQEPYPADPVQPYETPAPYETPEVVPDADCHPRARIPRVRALDPRVTRAVNRQWRRIERWLEANAPASRRTLGKPARARTIAVAEAQMGLRFPDDLRASLLRHDGAAVVGDTRPFGFLGNRNQGVREIRDTWRQLCEMDGKAESDAEADVRTAWWDGRMIPFGAGGGGDHLVADSVARDVGDTDHEGRMSFTPGGIRIRSYYGLLKATAHALETGGSVGHWKPVVDDGELDWEVVQDAVVQE